MDVKPLVFSTEPTIEYGNPLYQRPNWPSEFKNIYLVDNIPLTDLQSDKHWHEYESLMAFLEDCVNSWAIVYQRGPGWVTWAILNESKYAQICANHEYGDTSFLKIYMD